MKHSVASYVRPAGQFRAELEVLKSRFIAIIECVETTEQARAFLASVHAEMPTANHHVYAFIVGHGASMIEGMSDAGEPPGTAGKPVLAVLRGSDMGDVALVVVRYFGGTLLGTGGLVRAYTEAAQIAIAGVAREQKIDRVQVMLTLPYSLYERGMRTIRQYDAIVIEEDFAEDVTLLVALPLSDVTILELQLRDLTAGKLSFVLL
jgi:uncharacterized YigZ family protein